MNARTVTIELDPYFVWPTIGVLSDASDSRVSNQRSKTFKELES